MKQYLLAFFTAILLADLAAHTLHYGPPDPVWVVGMALVVLLLTGLPFLVAFDDVAPPTDAGAYGHRLSAAVTIAFAAGVGAFWATRELLTGQTELLVRLFVYPTLVHLSVRVANRVSVGGDRFPEHGRYWGTPWGDAETIRERSEE